MVLAVPEQAMRRSQIPDSVNAEPKWIGPAECIVIDDLLELHRQYTGTTQASEASVLPV